MRWRDGRRPARRWQNRGNGSYCGGDGDTAGAVASEDEAAVATAMEDVLV